MKLQRRRPGCQSTPRPNQARDETNSHRARMGLSTRPSSCLRQRGAECRRLPEQPAHGTKLSRAALIDPEQHQGRRVSKSGAG